MFVVGDLGWTDLGFMGNIHNFTPNIDRIAEETVMFTIAYSNAPTLASLLSGLLQSWSLYDYKSGRASLITENQKYFKDDNVVF